MNHDFRRDPKGVDADHFCDWLLEQTTQALAKDYGNGEATKASIFLFVNCAFEAHLPETKMGELFGKSMVSAGYEESDEQAALAWFETYAGVARNVYRTT